MTNDNNSYEVEKKWIIKSEDLTISKKLGYQGVNNIGKVRDIQIARTLEKLGIIDDYITLNESNDDQFYLPQDNLSPELINRLYIENNHIKSDGKRILEVLSHKEDCNPSGFLDLLQKFNNSRELPDYKRQLRLRTQRKNSEDRFEYIITAKEKLGEGDSNNIENEIFIPHRLWVDFFDKIGYVEDKSKRKSKSINKFVGQLSETEQISIEYTTIGDIEGVTFLEIETTSTNSPIGLEEIVLKTARMLNIENPENTCENRPYQKLQELVRN
jgi:hypothetical protein